MRVAFGDLFVKIRSTWTWVLTNDSRQLVTVACSTEAGHWSCAALSHVLVWREHFESLWHDNRDTKLQSNVGRSHCASRPVSVDPRTCEHIECRFLYRNHAPPLSHMHFPQNVAHWEGFQRLCVGLFNRFVGFVAETMFSPVCIFASRLHLTEKDQKDEFWVFCIHVSRVFCFMFYFYDSFGYFSFARFLCTCFARFLCTCQAAISPPLSPHHQSHISSVIRTPRPRPWLYQVKYGAWNGGCRNSRPWQNVTWKKAFVVK